MWVVTVVGLRGVIRSWLIVRLAGERVLAVWVLQGTMGVMGSTGYQRSKNVRGDSASKSKVILDRATLRNALTVDDSIEGGNAVGSAILTVFQSLAFGLLLVVLPVLLTSMLSTTLVDQDFHFGPALFAGIKIWLLSQGATVALSGASFSLVPLGVSALVAVVMGISVRRSLRPQLLCALLYCVIYVVVIGVAAAFVGEGLGGLPRAIMGSLGICVLSLLLGLRKRPDAQPLRASGARMFGRLPVWLRCAVVGAVASVAVAVLISTLITLIWVFLGKDSMGDVLEGWPLDALSGAGLGVTQMVLLPNLVVFALSWLAGPGFAIGAQTVISPSEVVLGPVPNLPLLAAIPQSTAPTSFAVLFAVAVGVAGLVGALAAARSSERFSWWVFLVTPTALAASVWLMMAALFWFVSGEIGGGSSLRIGVDAVNGASFVALWILCGALVGLVLGRSEPRTAVMALFRRNEKAYELDSID